MGTGARLLDWLEERSAEAVAMVGLVVLLLGALVVADERQDAGAEQPDAAARAAPGPASTAAVDDLRVSLPVPGPAVTTATSGTPTSAAPSPAPGGPTAAVTAPTPTAGPTEAVLGDQRVVVLSVDAPEAVRAGETVTFRVSVRARGGTPVLTGARFGDGTEGGRAAPCTGTAGPSFRGDLVVSHTYEVAGTYSPYFVARIPCGPASGAGTSLTVTGPVPTASGTPATGPGTPSPSPTPLPGVPPVPVPTGTPAPTGTTTP